MTRIRIRALVPGQLGPVYEYVTAYPARGEPDVAALEGKYGRLLEQEGKSLTFLENVGGGVKWQCTFDPPNGRIMRAVGSSWSDRIDEFQESSGGTLWTITWELKARGLPSYTQWLAFHLRDKRRVYQRLVSPVLDHFRGADPGG